MNNQRAQEIAASSSMVNVTCNGIPVYIQHVDANNETARIFPLDQPENEQNVPLSSLSESSEFVEMEVSQITCPLPSD